MKEHHTMSQTINITFPIPITQAVKASTILAGAGAALAGAGVLWKLALSHGRVFRLHDPDPYVRHRAASELAGTALTGKNVGVFLTPWGTLALTGRRVSDRNYEKVAKALKPLFFEMEAN